MPVVSISEPASHLANNFMADHRFQADESCSVCHGEITFGSDDSSFCANSACHGREWPSVELDAAFPHPIPLEGKHQEAWCHDCHEGEAKPVYERAVCHQPPEEHFEAGCETCHTPQGWSESVTEIVAKASRIPHSLHERDDCQSCHGLEHDDISALAAKIDLEVGQCVLCHKVAP
jgi:hypothetical protein